MNYTTKQLRNCSATVTTTRNAWGVVSHTLTSYNTDVCMFGMLDGEITNTATGELVSVDGEYFVILRAGWYDYSATTMQHVRKFLADYCDMQTTITELRKMALNPDETHVIIIDW